MPKKPPAIRTLPLVLAAALGACATAPVAPPNAAPAAPAMSATAAPAARPPPQAAARPLRIDSANSLIAITVRRAGLLAKLGHDHVVASRHIEGQAVAPANGQPGSASFRFRLDELTVDESALRAEAGLSSAPAADAIAGTRNNMLTKVLDAEKYPYVEVTAVTTQDGPMLAAITLHGVTRRYAVPALLTARADGVNASGTLTLKQTDFGIKPFAVFGGALAVQDELELRFNINAVNAINAPQ
jgi:polyisoprenoid-binding protein YceI